MANYARQKRLTLDRLTNKAVRASADVFAADLRMRSEQIFDDLNRGKNIFQATDVKYLRPKIDLVLENHLFLTTRTAVSDGMQEVTPDNRLGLWQLLPDTADPLLTISQLVPALGDKRDKIAQKYIKTIVSKANYSLKDLRNILMGDYLRYLRKGYRDVSNDWIKGESTIVDVQSMLSSVFGATKYEATRIFRTETTNFFNATRAEYFTENTDMDYMQIYSIADGRRSKICESRHGWVFPIAQAQDSDKMPAFHPHCRTIQRPLTMRLKSHRQMIERGLAMNPATFAPLPKNWGRAG